MVSEDLDILRREDAVDQIRRHTFFQSFFANDHCYFPGVTGEMHGRLGRGVASADEINMLAGAKMRFAGSRAVVHAGSGKLFFLGETEAMIFDARCANCNARNNFRSVREIHDTFAGRKFATHTLAGK